MERWRGSDFVGGFAKVHNKLLHPPREHGDAVMLGFLQSLFARPLVMLDAIAGDNRARPVTPAPAMDEDRRRQGFNERQRLGDLLGSWPANAGHGHVGID